MPNIVNTTLDWLADKLRASSLAIATVLLLLVVWFIAPQQLGIVAYKAALLSAGGFMGYWLDRTLFPYSRPDQTYFAQNHAEYRRAIVVAAALLAVGLSA